MLDTEQGSEEMLQLPIDAMSIEMPPFMFIALQKETLELELECFSTDDGTANDVDKLVSIWLSNNLQKTEVIVGAKSFISSSLSLNTI